MSIDYSRNDQSKLPIIQIDDLNKMAIDMTLSPKSKVSSSASKVRLPNLRRMNNIKGSSKDLYEVMKSPTQRSPNNQGKTPILGWTPYSSKYNRRISILGSKISRFSYLEDQKILGHSPRDLVEKIEKQFDVKEIDNFKKRFRSSNDYTEDELEEATT